MDRKKARKICNNFLQYHFKSNNNTLELNYDSTPFMNFLQAVWEDVRSSDYSDPDIFFDIIQNRISELDSIPSEINPFYDSLVDSVIEGFKRNIGEHFVLVPLQGSRVSKQISFGNKMFYLIPSEEDEEKMFSILSNIMTINHKDC